MNLNLSVTLASQNPPHPLRKHDAEYAMTESLVGVGKQRIGAIVGQRVARNAIRKIESGGKV